MNYLDIYRQSMRIRLFEKKVESEFSLGHMRGTTHGCVGQEIIPVLTVQEILHSEDYITGTHRCHGQVLAYSNDPYKLACEMMGKKDGFVKGLGGSQHIKVDNYITNGITGGMVTIGTGIAMGLRKCHKKGIVISFLGDGGFNEGYVQESLNISSKFELPILYICENNRYAMSTRTSDYSAGEYSNRVSALKIEYRGADTSEPDKLEQSIKDAFGYVRKCRRPFFLDVRTARLCGHSKSDPMDYMSVEEKEKNISEDPIAWLEDKISDKDINMIKGELKIEIDKAFERAFQCEELIQEIPGGKNEYYKD